MLNRQQSPESARVHLSALMDGQADARDWAQALEAWGQDPAQRADWHAYHLIGDALRSDDLVAGSSGGAAFLAGFRERLAQEPVVVAPVPVPVTGLAAAAGAAVSPDPEGKVVPLRPGRMGARAQRLLMPAAAVAGLAVVVGVAVNGRLSRETASPAAAVMAAASAGQPLPAGSAAQSGAVLSGAALPLGSLALSSESLQSMDAQMLRDARLDRYLSAHRPLSSAIAVNIHNELLRAPQFIVLEPLDDVAANP